MRHIRWIIVGILGLVLAAGSSVAAFSGSGAAGGPPTGVQKPRIAPQQGTPTDSPTPTPTGAPTGTTTTPTITPTPSCTLGVSWNVAPSPNLGNSDNYFDAMTAVAPNDIWAVGQGGGTLTVHWDGSSWSVVPSPNHGTDINGLYGVGAVTTNDVWAVGSYYVGGPYDTLTEHWNGNSWSIVPSPNPSAGVNNLLGVAGVASNDVWAVGEDGATLIEHWDGSQWTIVPSPNPGLGVNYLGGVTALASNNVWAVGYWNDALKADQTLIEHWDGSSWSVVPSPDTNAVHNFLYGVKALAANDIWAVGSSYDGGTSPVETLIEHWDGTAWSVVTSPNLGTTNNLLYSVSPVAGNDVWAVGFYSNGIYPDRQTLTEHWDGSQWTIVPSPNPGSVGNFMSAVVATASHDAWAVGYTMSGTIEQTLIEHYTDQFADVAPTDPFYNYIRCLVCRGIISGYNSSPPCTTGTPCFLSGANVTRGQISKFVSNAAGYADVIPSTRQTFSDVPPSSPFWVYVERAVLHGVISGYTTSPPCTTGVPCFLPGNNVTRGQTAKFVDQAGGYSDPIPSTQQTFTDVPSSSPFWLYVERAVAHGVISGYTNSPPCTSGVPCFLSGNNVTRGQTAKFVANTFFPSCQTPQR